MLVRFAYLVLVAAALVGQSGCCCVPWGGCWPDGNNWCGSQCGELFWSEWFSCPPDCCDPCDCGGCFTGPRLNDGLYSHGNDYTGYGQRKYPEVVQAEPASEPRPAPSAEPSPPSDAEPYTLPGPSEDMPIDSSSEVRRPAVGRRVSYDAPMSRGRGPAYDDFDDYDERPIYRGPVDSRQGSRKLAKPPRTRLFSR